MADFTLYCFAQSGNAYKAALMLNVCRADWTPRFVDFFHGETNSEAFREMNAMAEVPVLVRGDKSWSQSGVILDYLAEYFQKFGWSNDEERREILRWLLFDNHKLTSYIATFRYLLQFTKNPEPKVLEFLRQRTKSALGVLEQQVGKSDYIVGDHPTIADISLCGYLFWPEEFETNWSDYANIQSWLNRIKSLPGWVHPYELMPGYPLEE